VKDKLRKLIEASDYQIKWTDFERASYLNHETLESDVSNLFEDPFFDCELVSVEVEALNDLPEMFIVPSEPPELVRAFGTDYLNSSNRVVNLESLKGKTILFIQARPRKLKPASFIEQLYYRFPRVNLLIFLVIPFALIPAFYANIFNTRLIFNDSVYTLVFITFLFVSFWSIDYFLRYFVKASNLKHFEKEALKVENYLLALLPFLHLPGLITKWRMIESGRKVIWEQMSGIMLDLLIFFFIILILFLLLGYFTIFLVLFYVAIFLLSVVIRYQNYKAFIESEKSNQDLLLERISLIESRTLFNLDKRSVRNHFNERFKTASRFDTSVSTSNFYWEEFVRFSSFLASFVLFINIFYSVESNVAIFSILIALLILNGRASAALVGAVNKLYFIIISSYHAFKAFSDISEAIGDHAFKKGIVLTRIDSVKVENLSVTVENKSLVAKATLELRSGNLVGLYGRVGAGKSLLSRTLIQQHSEYRGSIVYNENYAMDSIDAQVFSRQVAYIDSKPVFLRGSIYYNFAIRGIRDKELVATLVNLIFPDSAKNFDFLFQKDINSINMSTGQAAKLNLFMGLSPAKSLFILDEAFSNMPLMDVADFFKYIKSNFKSAIFLVISHDRQILNMLGDVYELANKSLVNVKSSTEKVVPR
jgi:ABC-type bacteriocin/lantibiotic exporter with double-glycine peptidase domain